MVIKSKMFKSWDFVIALVLVSGVLFSSPRFAKAKEIKKPEGKPFFKMETLFVGKDDPINIRLPKIVVANDGTLIAFTGACRTYRTSKDKGETWSEIRKIWPPCGGANVVIDRFTGDILLLDQGKAGFWRSKDTAKTWKFEKAEFLPNRDGQGILEGRVTPPGTAGSNHGITLMRGKYKGRLVIPARLQPLRKKIGDESLPYHYQTVIYSDNHGKTWQTGEPMQTGTGEAGVVELSDGSLYLNSRCGLCSDDRRRIAWSYDGGQHWGDWSASDELFETSGTVPNLPHMKRPSYGTSAGLARMPDGTTEYDDVLIFACANEKLRYERGTVPKTENVVEWTKLIVMVSYDREETWPIWRHVPHDMGLAYTAATADKDGMIYVLFEKTSRPGSVDYVDFVKFNLAWVHEGHPIRIAELLEKAVSDDANTRKKAWGKLSKEGRSSDIESVMDVIINLKAKHYLSYAEDVVKKIFSRADDRSQCFRAVADYYAEATEATKEFILWLGAETGDDAALKLEQKALASGNKRLYGRALQTLASWPNELAAADLYRQAKGASEEVDRSIALQGYIRIAGLESAKLSTEERMAMLRKAINLASCSEEKKQIISNLQKVVNLESLRALQKYMADSSLRDEAHVSALNLAWKLRKHNSDEAIAMAEQITKSNNTTIAAKAREVLDKLEKNRAYILGWMVAGPYSDEGKEGAEVFKTVYPPQSGQKEVNWKELTRGIGEEKIDLGQTFGSMKYVCAYVKTTLVSPREQTVRLEMGSNDGIKAWLNGELVHSKWACRACTPGGDVQTVKLRKGTNEIMLKVVNQTSAWEFSCRLRQKNGKHIKGLTVEP